MKFLFPILILISNFSVNAQSAKINFSANYTSTAEVGWQKKITYWHNARCYPFGKASDTQSRPSEMIVQRFDLNNISPGHRTYLYSKQERHNIRSLEFNAKPVKPLRDFDQSFLVAIEDRTGGSHFNKPGSEDGCVTHEYHWAIKTHHVRGEANVNITLPQDKWFVELRIGRIGEDQKLPQNEFDKMYSDALLDYKGRAEISEHITGDLHNAFFKAGRLLVWAKPGSTIQLKIPMSFYSGLGSISQFKLNLRYFNASSAFPVLSLNQLQQKFVNVKDIKDQKIFAISLYTLGTHLIKNRSASKEMIGKVSIDTYLNQLNWLFDLANSTSLGAFGHDEPHIKAMAAVIGFQLALSLIEDFHKYCGKIDVKLPLTESQSKMPKFLYAYLALRPIINRIQTIDLSAVEAFLVEISAYQEKGLTYQQVAANKEELAKIQRAYRAIAQSGTLAPAVFNDFERGLLDVKLKTGVSTYIPEEETLVIAESQNLSILLKSIRDQFQSLAMSFNGSNTNKVQVGSLFTHINIFKDQLKDFQDEQIGKIKFVASEPGSTRQSFMVQVTSLLAHQVAIFDEPLKNQFIEPIRAAFAETDRVTNIKLAQSQCMNGDL